jgi:hypothetical protein
MVESVLPDDARGRPIQVLRLGRTYGINVSGTSASATDTFRSNIARVLANQTCYLNFNGDAAITDTPLIANAAEYIAVEPGSTIHAFATATGRLWITEIV